MPETKLSLARQWASRLIQPPLLVRATPYPSAQRLARLAENREGILRGPDQPRLDRADQGVVEEPLGLGARRLLALTSGLKLVHHGAAVAQEREEPLEERVGLRGRLVTHGAHGSGEGRPCAMLAHAQTTP